MMKLVRSSTLPDSALQFIAKHLVAEFGHIYPHWNVEVAVRELSEDAGQGLPLHMAAIENENVLGIASVISEDEVTGWEGKGWWLANVLVLPEYRNRGIGKKLVNQAVEIARSSRAIDLHLVTDTAQAWYLEQGWASIGTGDVHGHSITIMRLDLVTTNHR